MNIFLQVQCTYTEMSLHIPPENDYCKEGYFLTKIEKGHDDKQFVEGDITTFSGSFH